MGFQVPNKSKVNPTEDEELFNDAWAVIEKDVDAMLAKGWNKSLSGRSNEAVKFYQGANVYFYLIYLAQATRTNLSLLNYTNNTFETKQVLLSSLECIDKNLPCLSVYFNTDYREAWKKILEAFSLDIEGQDCSECCPGLGDMIIGDTDDCLALILGACEENTSQEPYGEFTLDEFVEGEFTNFNE